MSSIRYKVYAVLVLIFLAVTSAFSELEIEKSGTIEVLRFPVCRLKVKISDDGNTIDLNKLTVTFKEMEFSTVADSIISTNDNNTYYVYWKSKLTTHYPYQVVFFTYGNEVAVEKFFMPKNNYPIPTIICFTPLKKPFLYFNKPLPGQETEKPLDIQVRPNGTPHIVIDSIKTFTEFFRVKFSGGHNNWNPPPGEYREGYYYLSIYFNGQDNNFYSDSLVIYFNGNQKVKVNLIANSYKVETKESICIVEPTKDSVWVPCFDKKIVWQGGNKGSMYLVNVSYDGGYEWENVGETLDTFLFWNVRNVPTENALIRVFQRYQESPEFNYADLNGFNYTVYEPYARMLAACTYGGKVQEFIFDENGEPKTSRVRYLKTEPEEDEEFEVTGVQYTRYTSDEVRDLAVAHHRRYLPFVSAKDEIAIFKDQDEEPYKRVQLNYVVSKMQVDEKARYLTILPHNSNQLHLYNTENYDLHKTLSFRYPVTGFRYTPFGDSLFVTLMSNEIIVLGSDNLEEIDRKSYSDLPMITGAVVSPDGNFLAVSTASIPMDLPNLVYYKSAEAPIYVYDTKTGVNIRSYFSNRFNPMGMDFTPHSNAIVVGSHKREHIMKRDLNNQLGLDYFNFANEFPNDTMASYSYANREGYRVAGVMQNGELYINRFAFTQSGKMAEPFKIRNPKVKVESYDFEEVLVDHKTEQYLKALLCNVDELPMIVHENYMLQYGVNYSFYLDNPDLPDTLYPGECREFHVLYHANDTGKVVDTIKVASCGNAFYIPLMSYSQPRNIDFYEKVIEFGEACVNTPKSKIVNLLKNMDTVDLKIKELKIENIGNYANFRIKGETKDIIVPPNQDLLVELEFTPAMKEKLEAKLHIFYTNNPKFVYTKDINGTGIGGEIFISHNKLMFIPEIRKRQIHIKNTGDREIKIKGVRFQPMQLYKLNGQLPITLAVGDSITYEVESIAELEEAKLHFDIEPCAVNSVIELGKYSSTSTLTLLDKEVDPQKPTAIDIYINSAENASYKGVRPLESEFTIAEKIFIPEEGDAVFSQYGKGQILRNEVIDGLRHIRFRLEGDFPAEGVIASILGYPGLTEPNESEMRFNESEEMFNFGTGVSTRFQSGKFKISNVCGGKMLFWGKTNPQIGKVYPNPAERDITIELESVYDEVADIEVYNQAGLVIKRFSKVNLTKGNNSIELNINDINTGTYNLIIRTKDDSAGCRITIIK